MRISFLKSCRGYLVLVTGFVMLACLVSGSALRQRKITIVFTGELCNIFHPFGEDPEQSENLQYLNVILNRLKKSYPDALFVDTGGYVNAADYVETMYSTPGMVHFKKHGYNAVNLGIKEILFGTSVNLDEEKNASFMVTCFQDAKTNIFLAKPHIDFDIPQIPRTRILGAGSLDCSFSAPAVRKDVKNSRIPETLSFHLKSSPEPCLTILLSDLPHSENIALARSLPDLDLILESGIDPVVTLAREKETYLCRKTEVKSIGVLHVKMDDMGKISGIHFKSYPLRGREGFLFFKKDKIPAPVKPPLPHLGKFEDGERFLSKLSAPHKIYEISRVNAGPLSPLAASPHICYIDLFDKQNHLARTFYVEHILGNGWPEFRFFATLDLENRIKKVDFAIFPTLGGLDPDFNGFLKPYIGKKWNEIEFQAQGCGGAVEVFHSLYLDISLVSRLADDLIEKK